MSLFFICLYFIVGEPFVDGEVVPYNDKYHADWIWNQHNNKLKSVPCPREARRKRKKN